MFSLEEPINKVIDKLKDDKNYYGDYGKQYLSNSNIRSLINSPNEFKNFIGDDIKLDPVIIDTSTTVEELLRFYMGKNTPDRQQFIIDNLKVELDIINENLND